MRREVFNRLCLTLLVIIVVSSIAGYFYYLNEARESQAHVTYWNDRMTWFDINCGEYRDTTGEDANCRFNSDNLISVTFNMANSL